MRRAARSRPVGVSTPEHRGLIGRASGCSGARMAEGRVARRAARIYIGIAGLLAAYAVGRVIGSLLYSVPSLDLPVYGLTIALLITVSLAACWMPARAATRTDPMLSIRSE